MKQLGKSQLNKTICLMMILNKFEEELINFINSMDIEAKAQVEAKTQVDVMEETIILQEEEEDMAELIHMVTITLIITWEGIIVLSTRMKSVIFMEEIRGVNVYTTREGK